MPHQPPTSRPAPFSYHRSHICSQIKSYSSPDLPKLHFHFAHPANKMKNQNPPAYRAVRANIFITGKKGASGVSSYLAHHQQTPHPQGNRFCTPWPRASSSPPQPCALLSAHTKENLPRGWQSCIMAHTFLSLCHLTVHPGSQYCCQQSTGSL